MKFLVQHYLSFVLRPLFCLNNLFYDFLLGLLLHVVLNEGGGGVSIIRRHLKKKGVEKSLYWNLLLASTSDYLSFYCSNFQKSSRCASCHFSLSAFLFRPGHDTYILQCTGMYIQYFSAYFSTEAELSSSNSGHQFFIPERERASEYTYNIKSTIKPKKLLTRQEIKVTFLTFFRKIEFLRIK